MRMRVRCELGWGGEGWGGGVVGRGGVVEWWGVVGCFVGWGGVGWGVGWEACLPAPCPLLLRASLQPCTPPCAAAARVG